MVLAPGARIGSFEVLTQLGVGGMGEVYRARDTRLDRIVALKVLSDTCPLTAERIGRLKREAQAISRVSHAHICQLYDIGEQDGTTFLVMEYVQGETLADRLERGALPLRDVLRFGVQIADALAEAHQAGVVHRDLKPSNIMLTRDGVKLLDFGLAKLRAGSTDLAPIGGTASVPLSAEGLVVGTVSYMAPEQLEGKAVDAPADLFSLGVVLYEMTSGVRPFQGDSTASLIAAILTHEPAPLRTRQPLAPPSFDRAVRRCLAKDPGARWQTARDLAAELQWIFDTLHETLEPAPTHTQARRSFTVLGGSAAVLAILAGVAMPALRSSRAALPTFRQVTFRRGTITSARFAPDGQTIVYSASWEGQPYDLFMTRQGSTESRPLGIPDARLFGISASGEMAFVRGRQTVFRSVGTLARVPLAGGVPRDLLENVTAADWSPDETQMAVVRAVDNGRLQVEYPVGTKVYASATPLGSIRVSPAGDRVAFIEGQAESGCNIVVGERTGTKAVLSTGWTPALGLAWSRDGREIWFTGSRGDVAPGLRAVSLSGQERLLAPAPDALQLQDIFQDGRVLAVRHHGREGFACRAADETVDRDLSWYDGSSIEALSADGHSALFGETRGAGGRSSGIYLRRTDGSPAVRLGDGYPEDLSPDGRWILARPSVAAARERGWVLVPVGAGTPRTLPLGKLTALYEADFLPDGKRVVFGGREPGRGARIYVQDLNGGEPRPISPEGWRTDALPTPDGRFVEGAAGATHILFPVDGGDPRALPFLTASDSPVQWSPDGRFLYVVRGHQWSDTPATIYQTMEAVIERVDATTGARRLWKSVRAADPVGLEAINNFFITPDGRAYCYGYVRSLSDLFIIEGVK